MPIISYPIFKAAKRKKIYLEFYALSLIFFATIGFIWSKSIPDLNEYIFWIEIILYILSFVPLILVLILNHYKIDFKKGKFQGNMILHLNQIVVNNEKIPLDNITSIYFKNDDFFIRFERNKIIGPKISNGTGNICEIKTINGKIYRFNFYQSHDNELVKAEVSLRYYQSKNKLTLANLNKILEGHN